MTIDSREMPARILLFLPLILRIIGVCSMLQMVISAKFERSPNEFLRRLLYPSKTISFLDVNGFQSYLKNEYLLFVRINGDYNNFSLFENVILSNDV